MFCHQSEAKRESGLSLNRSAVHALNLNDREHQAVMLERAFQLKLPGVPDAVLGLFQEGALHGGGREGVGGQRRLRQGADRLFIRRARSPAVRESVFRKASVSS